MEEVQDRQQCSSSKDLVHQTESNIDLATVTRPKAGTLGKPIKLIANHFKVSLKNTDTNFYQYNISFHTEDKRDFSVKAVSRKIVDKFYETYASTFSDPNFAYDGVHSLYTTAPIPNDRMEYKVAIEESFSSTTDAENFSHDSSSSKRLRRSSRLMIYYVKIGSAAKIPIKPLALAVNGAQSEGNVHDALRVLDTILKHHAMKMGKCLALRQSFFHEDCQPYSDIGNGVTVARGFYTSFRTSQESLLLNIDTSAALVFKPGPVIDFLLTHQDVNNARWIKWDKAISTLKNLKVKASHKKGEYKIIGLSEKPCNQQFFSMRERNGNNSFDITVYDYFTKHLNVKIEESAFLPCLNVGKPNRPSYLPLELCSLVSLQRYKKQFSPTQITDFVAKSRQKPEQAKQSVIDATTKCNFETYPLLSACGATIEKLMVNVMGRVLKAPKIVFRNTELYPQNGKWNFNNKLLFHTVKLKKWAIVNFSWRGDMSYISRELVNCAGKKGFEMGCPSLLVEEDPQTSSQSPTARVENMCSRFKSFIIDLAEFVLCILPERKCSQIYGPWKRKFLCEFGVPTQCISPTVKPTDQYLTNVLLKINAKLGGINSLLDIERSPRGLPVSKVPTLIVGMDICHGPANSCVPSIAAVVGSQCWPYISRYSAFTRTLPPKHEMIDCLFQRSPNGNDSGLMRDVLLEFYRSTNGKKPKHIVIFRDGVGESQFDQVLNIEFQQIKRTYQGLNDVNLPKFTIIVAQKRHHTKLFKAHEPGNIPPGTVVDTGIVNSNNFNFFLCAHQGIIGTSRPVHYHVLLDDYGYSADLLQELIHSLSYAYQRGSNATSLVAPICYAHHAAAQVAQFLHTDGSSEDFSELPLLHQKVRSSMFFC